jgi:hypothetical protein
MPAKPRMLFRDVDGSPVPIKPLDQRGTPIVPDGKIVLSIKDAARRFNAEPLALAVLYWRVMKNVLSADELVEMMIEEGGELGDLMK